jgi:hypothetical protein
MKDYYINSPSPSPHPKKNNFEIIGKLDLSFVSRYGRTWVKVNGRPDVLAEEVAPGNPFIVGRWLKLGVVLDAKGKILTFVAIQTAVV